MVKLKYALIFTVLIFNFALIEFQENTIRKLNQRVDILEEQMIRVKEAYANFIAHLPVIQDVDNHEIEVTYKDKYDGD